MATVAGINGCKGGWFCVFEEMPSRQLGSKIFPTVDDLARHATQIDVVAIDVPIGLTEAGPRACDEAARRLLGAKRASSVFPAPVRSALGAATYEEACERSFAAQGKKLPKQSWGIYPKIRQLDELLRSRSDLGSKFFEVHPEVCFRGWNDEQPIIEPKKSAEGFEKRARLIRDHFGANVFDTIRSRYKRSVVADDDILDAFAALWTAERILAGSARTIPPTPSLDTAGLPMRMVY